jgi:ketosteroid isomerase-like protein
MPTPTEALRTFYECFDAGDVDRLVDLFHPDGVFDVNETRRTGHDEIRQEESGIIGQLSNRGVTYTAIAESGDIALAEAVFRADQPDGRRLELRFAAACEMRGDKIARLSEYFDMSGMQG